MAMSDFKVTSGRAAVNAVVGRADPQMLGPIAVTARRRWHPRCLSLSCHQRQGARTPADSCDFVCACIALPLSLILLSRLSSVQANPLGQLTTNLKLDSLFPFAVVLALALGGVYRVARRRLQPSVFLELRELSFGVGCGAVSPWPSVRPCTDPRNGRALRHPARHGGHRGHRSHQLGRIVLRLVLRTLTTTRVLVVGSGKSADRVMLSIRQDPAMTLVGRAVEGDTVDAGAIGKVTNLPDSAGSSRWTASWWRPTMRSRPRRSTSTANCGTPYTSPSCRATTS